MTTMTHTDTDIARAKVDGATLFGEWLELHGKNTKASYKTRMSVLQKRGLINLQSIAEDNLNEAIDKIFSQEDLTVFYKQDLVSVVISFSKFLHRRTLGAVSVALPGVGMFKMKRHKVVRKALTLDQLATLLQELEKVSERAFLIGSLCLFGAKRVNEVLNLKTEDILWEKREVSFTQSKTNIVGKKITITLGDQIIERLKAFVGERTGYVFVTKKGTSVCLGQVQNDFNKAASKAGLPEGTTSHTMRTSAITIWASRNYRPDQIMRVSGHASVEQVIAYDKTEAAENLTKYDHYIERMTLRQGD